MQIDDPVLVRYPEKALQYGIDYLSKCFADLPNDVFKTVHICCGYPQYLVSYATYYTVYELRKSAQLSPISVYFSSSTYVWFCVLRVSS